MDIAVYCIHIDITTTSKFCAEIILFCLYNSIMTCSVIDVVLCIVCDVFIVFYGFSGLLMYV